MRKKITGDMKMDEIAMEKFDNLKITADHKKVDPKVWRPDDPPTCDQTAQQFKDPTLTHSMTYGNIKKHLRLEKLIFSVSLGLFVPYVVVRIVIDQHLIINVEQ